MDEKLYEKVGRMSYLQKKIYDFTDNMQYGEIPDADDVETLFSNLEEANAQRVEILKSLSVQNCSASFMEPVIFRDNSEIKNAHLYGEPDAALDFIATQQDSKDIFMQQMAMYVAICL